MAPRLRLLGKLAPMDHRKLFAAIPAACPCYSAVNISSEHRTCRLLAGPRIINNHDTHSRDCLKHLGSNIAVIAQRQL